MERRSRSTTRGGDFRHSSARFYSEGGGAAGGGGTVPPPSLAHRPGGDARTLSPDRRNGRGGEGIPGNSYKHKSSSYNHYTMNRPPASLVMNGFHHYHHHHHQQQQHHHHHPRHLPPRASMPHLPSPSLPPPTGPPPPRPPPPSSSPHARTTSTPQSTPVRYEDFAEGLNSSMRQQSPQKTPPKTTTTTTTTTTVAAPVANGKPAPVRKTTTDMPSLKTFNFALSSSRHRAFFCMPHFFLARVSFFAFPTVAIIIIIIISLSLGGHA